jgi:putative FmdB family regulatory protein
MPTYEYLCGNCEHYFKNNVPFSDHAKACDEPCPECDEKAVKQTLTTMNYYARDSGFKKKQKHNTDFNSKLKKIKEAHPNNTIDNAH